MSSRRNPCSLTIFFPCYNDAGTIGTLVVAATLVAGEFTDDYEILVVDDGSTDRSVELLQQLQKDYARLRLVCHPTNQGYGAALRTGFAQATKDLIFYTDGDGQYDVLELRALLPLLQEGVDVVNGYKIVRSDPWYRVAIGWTYLQLMRRLFQFQVRDVDCDFRLIRRRVFERITLHHPSGVICLELIKKLERAGCRFAEVPVHHYHRLHGRSQFFNLRHLVVTGVDLLKLWWELNVRPHARSARSTPHPWAVSHRV
ncbi:MAG: glycosyl transferase [Omnitrophica WOR_2 bacterium RIFCSPLOWO2_02_FULL_63_16]|nr:MAG: glycosyl transferase [Omnitrophica WOR_2 bacterium RIFCSPLOWO2_02_FULL_63_16]